MNMRQRSNTAPVVIKNGNTNITFGPIQVKIFKRFYVQDLENDVNHFLSSSILLIEDVSFQSQTDASNSREAHCIILYRRQKNA